MARRSTLTGFGCVVCGLTFALAFRTPAAEAPPAATQAAAPTASQPSWLAPGPSPGVRILRPELLTRVALLGDPAFRHFQPLTDVRLTADDKCIVAGTGWCGTVHFWDAATGRDVTPRLALTGSGLGDTMIFPDGKRLLAGFSAGPLYLWDLDKGKVICTIAHKGQCAFMAFDSGYRHVFTKDSDGEVVQWDLETGKEVRRLNCHKDAAQRDFRDCAITPDGKSLITLDSSIRVWDIATDHLQRQRQIGAGTQLRSVIPDPTGRRVMCFAGDDKFSVLDLSGDGNPWHFAMAVIGFPVFSPDGNTLGAAVGENGSYLFDAASGAEVWHSATKVDSVLFSPDGKSIVATNPDGFEVLDAANGKPKMHGDWPGGQRGWGMVFSHDGKRMYCIIGNALCGWSLETGQRLFVADAAPGHCVIGAFDFLAVAPDGGTLYSRTPTSPVVVWDVQRAAVRAVWDVEGAGAHGAGAGPGVKSLDLSPDGRRLLAGGSANQAFVWDTATGKKTGELHNPSAGPGGGRWQMPLWVQEGRGVAWLCYQTNLQRGLLEDGRQSILNVWHADKDGGPLSSHTVPCGDNGVNCAGTPRWVICGGEKDWVVAVGNDVQEASHVYVLTLEGGEVLTTPPAPFGQITSVAVGPRQRTLAVLDGGNRLSVLACAAAAAIKIDPMATARSVKDLAADDYDTRAAAAAKLIASGPGVLPYLEKADSADAEVVAAVKRIRMEISKAEIPDQPVGKPLALGGDVLDVYEQPCALALHPDGRHWAVAIGRWRQPELILGELTDEGPMVLRRIKDLSNGPVAVCFSRDGSTLFVGNGNTTISVYRETEP